MNRNKPLTTSIAAGCVASFLFVLSFATVSTEVNAGTTNPATVSTSGYFPGPLMTLIERWAGASLVVRADVTESIEHENRFHTTLRVKATLKGKLADDSNEVVVQSLRGGCPWPYQFKVGTDVIVFLRYDMERRAYVPKGAIEGAIEVDDQTFALYSEMLKRLPAIVDLDPESDERLLAMMDWYVDCLISPQTDLESVSVLRREGLRGIRRVQWRHGRRNYSSELADPLSEENREKILAALLSETPPKPGASAMANIVAETKSKKLDLHLLTSLERCHMPGWEILSDEAVEVLPARLGITLSKNTQRLINQLKERLDDLHWGDLMDEEDDDLDEDVEEFDPTKTDEFLESKRLLDIMWGVICNEALKECQAAFDKHE